MHIKVIADELDIPYLSIKTNNQISNNSNNYELNIHPSIEVIQQAVIDLIQHFEWLYVTVIYQDPKRLEQFLILAENLMNYDSGIQFRFRLLNSNNLLDILKEIKSSGSFRLVIDIEANLINKFMNLVREPFLSIFRFPIFFSWYVFSSRLI